MSNFSDEDKMRRAKEVVTEIIDQAKQVALLQLNNAQVAISNHRVGAAVIAGNRNKQPSFRVFGGSNIELATSRVVHAEFNALMAALCNGYPDIVFCIVTSNHTDQQAAMCGYCMQDFMYANPDCVIIVLNPDGTEKLTTTVKERNGKYAYLGKGKLQL